ELVVSNCIFGDGAAATVLDLVPDEKAAGFVSITDFASGLFPQYREELRYKNEGGRLRNHLSKRVPSLGARTAKEVVTRLLEQYGLSRKDIDHWAVHPGGTVVLSQVGKELELDSESLRHSYHIFENYGNMSSPSVLFVLQQLLKSEQPKTGQKGMLVAFGAGFSAFAALLEF
ncbi:MAG: 3-oxoacyl-[acyl-carrier-protein] synthase III C-terminal domain-containing protein, partial [Lentisphaeria bacterium]